MIDQEQLIKRRVKLKELKGRTVDTSDYIQCQIYTSKNLDGDWALVFAYDSLHAQLIVSQVFDWSSVVSTVAQNEDYTNFLDPDSPEDIEKIINYDGEFDYKYHELYNLGDEEDNEEEE